MKTSKQAMIDHAIKYSFLDSNGNIDFSKTAPNYNPLVTLTSLGFSIDEKADSATRVRQKRILDKETVRNQMFTDKWSNTVASIGSNNSVQQHTDFIFERMTYQECASLANDTMINKAVTTISNEMFSKGGVFKSVEKCDELGDTESIDELQEIFDKKDFFNIVKLASVKALQFGGAMIYINTTDKKLDEPLFVNEYTTCINNVKRFKNFKVLEPWQFAPASINTFNPLEDNYMKPDIWYIMGAGMVHSSRLIPIVFFDINYLYSPLYNFLGLPLSYYMRNYVATADTIRQSLGDLFLRFSNTIIKTSAQKLTSDDGYERVKHIIQTRNNLGAVVLEQSEDMIQVNTSITGLQEVVMNAYELVVASSHVPVTKLLGVEPSGFQSTGEHTMRNYYDTITGFQNNVVKKAIEHMGCVVSNFYMGVFQEVVFEFSPVGAPSEKEKAEIVAQKITLLVLALTNDLLSREEARNALRDDNYDFSTLEDLFSEGELTTNDYDITDIKNAIVEVLGNEQTEIEANAQAEL